MIKKEILSQNNNLIWLGLWLFLVKLSVTHPWLDWPMCLYFLLLCICPYLCFTHVDVMLFYHYEITHWLMFYDSLWFFCSCKLSSPKHNQISNGLAKSSDGRQEDRFSQEGTNAGFPCRQGHGREVSHSHNMV